MNVHGLLNHKTKTVGAAAGILAVSSLLSRFLGVARDWLLAKSFGAGADLDVYFAAFKIPDFIYNILILGGVLVAFLPLFSEYFSKDEKEAWDFTSNCMNTFLFLLILISVFLFIFTPQLIKLIAPGFNYEQIQKTILLTRIMFLSPIFFSLSSVFSGILQYFNRFLVYSLCPILYNLGIIFGIIVLSPRFGILGVGLGVVFGAFIYFAIQIPSVLNCGFKYRAILNFKDVKIKRIFTLMMPRIFGVSVQQINLIIINAIASTLTTGSISVFNFANNIRFFPIGIIGISFATAVFPSLSRNWAENEKDKFIRSFSSVFRQILYLIIPISVLIFILKNQIVEIILSHGQFSDSAAKLTAASLGLFCFGLFGSALITLFFRAFFSLRDTVTPTLIALIAMGINIGLSFFFTQALRFSTCFNLQRFFRNVFFLQEVNDISVLGLPLAVSISTFFQFVLLFFFLKRKIGDFGFKKISMSFYRILISVVLLIIVVYPVSLFISRMGALWQMVIIGFIGSLTYLLSTLVLGSPEVKVIKSLLLEKFFSKRNYA